MGRVRSPASASQFHPLVMIVVSLRSCPSGRSFKSVQNKSYRTCECSRCHLSVEMVTPQNPPQTQPVTNAHKSKRSDLRIARPNLASHHSSLQYNRVWLGQPRVIPPAEVFVDKLRLADDTVGVSMLPNVVAEGLKRRHLDDAPVSKAPHCLGRVTSKALVDFHDQP